MAMSWLLRGILLARRRRIFTNLGEHGFGVIEAVMLAVVVTIIGFGLLTLTVDSDKMIAKANLGSTVVQLRDRLQQTIQDSDSWSKTVGPTSANAEMACLRNNTACVAAAWNPIELRDSNDVVVFDGRTATAGFDRQGVGCNTYPSAACPISFQLEWQAICAPSCVSPTIEVRGIARVFSAEPMPGGGLGSARYRFTVFRGGSQIRQDRIEVFYQEFDNSGEGGCSVGGTVRSLGSSNDPAGNIVSLAANTVTLKAGVYVCRVVAPAFRVGANRIRLVSTAGTQVSILGEPAFAALLEGGASVATLSATLNLNLDTSLRVVHSCESNPNSQIWGDTNINHGLGLPVSDSGGGYGTEGTVYTKISCLRTS